MAVSDWLNQTVTGYYIPVADWLAQGEVANHSKDIIDSYWTIN